MINVILPGFLIVLVFVFVDALWIDGLRPLDISFGSVRPPLFLFSFLRASLFFGWMLILLILTAWWTPITIQVPLGLLVACNLGLLAFGLYGFYIEPFHLTVSRITMPVPGLKQPVRLVQLSDIHVEYTTRRERELSSLVASLHPDMIVMTADYLNESYTRDPHSINDLRELIKQFHAPLGIYAVNGNVESPWEMTEWFKGLDVHALDDQVVRLPQINSQFVMLGLSYFDIENDSEMLVNLMGQVQPGVYTLLLYHTPDLAYTARDEGINLFLAGHTHGGQVRLPFYGALFTNSKYGKTFEMGLYRLAHMTLFVSRGLGFTGGGAPRIRFLAPPEVVVIDLTPPG